MVVGEKEKHLEKLEMCREWTWFMGKLKQDCCLSWFYQEKTYKLTWNRILFFQGGRGRETAYKNLFGNKFWVFPEIPWLSDVCHCTGKLLYRRSVFLTTGKRQHWSCGIMWGFSPYKRSVERESGQPWLLPPCSSCTWFICYFSFSCSLQEHAFSPRYTCLNFAISGYTCGNPSHLWYRWGIVPSEPCTWHEPEKSTANEHN